MTVQETGVKATILDYDEFMTGLKMMNAAVKQMGDQIAKVAKQTDETAKPKGGGKGGGPADTMGLDKLLAGMQESGNAFEKIIGMIGSRLIPTLASAAGGAGNLVGMFAGPAMKTALTGVAGLASLMTGPVGLVVAIGAAILAAKSLFDALKAGFQAVTQMVTSAVQSVFAFGQEGLMLASRFREMENAAISVGQAFGFTEEMTRESIDTISEAGIRYDIAAGATMKMIRNQIDLANSYDLVRIAQATGIAIGEDSSATFERLIYAISTGNTAMLGFMNITVTQNDIEREALELYGKRIDQLTAFEKTQARVNAIIAGSSSIMGVYDAAMDSAGKSLRSLTERLIPSLKAELMKTFEPAFKASVDAVSNFIKALIEATQEGGDLYPVLVTLGTIASFAADAFSWLLNSVSENMHGIMQIIQITLGVLDKVIGAVLFPQKYVAEMAAVWMGIEDEARYGFTQIIEDMFRWGAEIIAALAEGMVSALHSAMTVLSNAIGGMLEFLLAPGSPPRVAPDLDKWGAATMTEYLRAFTEADFSVLKSVQSSMSSFLGKDAMAALSKGLIGDVAREGGVGESFFKRIANSAGIFGQEVSKLARLEYAVADATRRMEEANRKYEMSQLKVTGLTAEYNKMLKEGVDEQVLSAKLAEINVAEQERLAAAQEVQATATDISDQERALKLQKELVDQLVTLNKVVAKAADPAEKLAKGMGEGMEQAGKAAEGAFGDISNKIQEAIDRMKEQIKSKLADIFQPLIDAWDNIKVMLFGGIDKDTGEEVIGIITMFENMKENLSAIATEMETRWTMWKDSISLKFEILKLNIAIWVEKLRYWFTIKVPQYIEKVYNALKDKLIPKVEELRDKVGADVDSVLSAFKDWGTYMWEEALPGWLKDFLEFLGETGKSGLVWALEQVEDVFFRIVEGMITLMRAIIEARKEWKKFIEGFSEGAAETLPYQGQSPSPLAKGIMTANDAMKAMIPTIGRMSGAFASTNPVPGTAQTSMRGTGGGTVTNRTGNVTIGTVIINSQMSMTDFRNRVVKAVVGAV